MLRLFGGPSKQLKRALRQLRDNRSKEFYSTERFNDYELQKLLKRVSEARIRVLELSGYLTDSACAVLANILGRRQSVVTDLQLQGNNIGDDGARHIAEAIMKAPNLEKLDLSWNKIGDEGAKCLAEAIRRSSLKSLDLSYNTFTDNGARILTEALRESRMKSLRLSANSVSPSIIAFADETLRLLNSERFLIAATLCSARVVKRLGKKSPLSSLPIELIREVVYALFGDKHRLVLIK